MIRNYAQSKTGRAAFVFFTLCLFAAVALSLFFGLGTALGAGGLDASVIGVGQTQADPRAEGYEFNAAEKLGFAAEGDDVPAADAAAQLGPASKRAITVKDPDPVVELAAVDLGDAHTAAIASRVGVLNPPAGAPRLAVDTSGEDWLVGQASGYDVAGSSTLTRSGRAFDDDCVTVAVPEGQEELLGRAIEIVYEGQVVVATVTDTGGFAKYGRVLDLGGGVVKAFGFKDVWDWGVREVRYRFL